MRVKRQAVVQKMNDPLFRQEKINVEPARRVGPYNAGHQKTKKYNGRQAGRSKGYINQADWKRFCGHIKCCFPGRNGMAIRKSMLSLATNN